MQKKDRILILTAFGTLAVIILAMMVATVLDKLYGSPLAFRWVYHHPLFFVLWAVLALAGIALLVARKTGRRPWTLLLHLSFVVILAGALLTHLTGEDGIVRLPRGKEVSQWESSDGTLRALPSPVTLEEFEILYYTGSEAPSDYRSRIRVRDEVYEISMNHIARIDGYRFYQSGYDQESSILRINHDPLGIGVTYTGYVLLLLSLLGFFFQRNSVFRSTLKRVLQSSALVIVLALLTPAQARAQDSAKEWPQEVADAFGDLYVYYNDRICPFETLARDYSLALYKNPDWKETLKDCLSYKDTWKLFPVADSTGLVRWYASQDALPVEVIDDYDRWLFIRKVLDMADGSVQEKDWEEVQHIVGKIMAYQVNEAGPVLPSAAAIRAEKAYNRIARPKIPFMVSLTWGLLLFILLGISLSRNRPFPRKAALLSFCLACLLLVYLTVTLGLRWYVSGHAPFAGSYSVMMLMAWLAALGICLLWKKYPMVLPAGFLLAGFTLLMASMAGAKPQITPLMPVLHSPLLAIHVLSMMLSYTLLGMVALNGVLGLFVPQEASERLRDISLIVLYPAVFLLVFGTFLGAVWANISWGNYWAWDPKETWALVTFLVYSFALHGGLMKAFRNPRFFHAFTLLAFLCVLITYFGVNLFLGGMHSYA